MAPEGLLLVFLWGLGLICLFWPADTRRAQANSQVLDDIINHYGLVDDPADFNHFVLSGIDTYGPAAAVVRQGTAEYQIRQEFLGKLLAAKTN